MITFNKNKYLYLEELTTIMSNDVVKLLEGKSFLITGATGLIGMCLIDAIMFANNHGANITIYAVGRDRNKAENRLGEYFKDEHFHFIEQDVRNPLPSDFSVDYIIPLASNTHPKQYATDAINTITTNIIGTKNIDLNANI